MTFEEREVHTTETCKKSGKIAIAAFDKSAVVYCISVKSSKILGSGKDEPKYVLNGIDQVTLLGEHTTTLGWYASEEDIQKEISTINEAIMSGKESYELQYAANIEYVGIFGKPRIVEK